MCEIALDPDKKHFELVSKDTITTIKKELTDARCAVVLNMLFTHV